MGGTRNESGRVKGKGEKQVIMVGDEGLLIRERDSTPTGHSQQE